MYSQLSYYLLLKNSQLPHLFLVSNIIYYIFMYIYFYSGLYSVLFGMMTYMPIMHSFDYHIVKIVQYNTHYISASNWSVFPFKICLINVIYLFSHKILESIRPN